MIGFGLRLAVAGGREALTRLVIIAAAVAVGAGLLLATFAGVNAVNAQLTRYASMYPHASPGGDADPLWWSTREDYFHGKQITRIDVAATGPSPPTPIGIPATPGPGEYYASPSLQKLLSANPADQLGDRYPGHDLGTIGSAALPSPDALLVIVGGTPEGVAKLPFAKQLTSVGDNIPALPETTVDLILGVIAGGLLFPVLIFIGTATRLSAARREQRFAAMRLVGATPKQISVVAAVEATAAAVAGTALGFILFFAFRGSLANIPFTGMPFFTSDMSLGVLDVLLVALGVPAGAAVAAQISLRRVRISPLGVTRRVTPRPPRAYRLIPLVLGVGVLAFAIGHRPETSDGQTAVFLPGLLLIMAGLVLAGPWLTMVGARLMARRASRPAALIAARRLADNPKAGFRAISGIMLALFVTSVAVGVITTIVANRGPAPIGSTDAGTLSTVFVENPPRSVPDTVLADLRSIPGVQTATVVRENPVNAGAHEPGVVACTDIPKAYGRCADGATVAEVPMDFIPFRGSASATRMWPAASVPLGDLQRLPVTSLVVGTDGSAAALERSRTVLESAYPTFWVAPNVPGDFESDFADTLRGWQQLANVIIIASLALAGCSLAVSVVGGLSERKRPFSLLRLSGAPVRVLRRVVALETAVPMLAVAVVAVGMGFLAAQLFLKAQMEYTLTAPSVGFYAIVAVGLAACLGIIASTLPLLERITGPETARSE
ncbi:ABC transporter permease [Micromonospora inositola]|uniref:FtsX-like permease family protein n=1 Tax=Micromonospora inositola TaxID=47865 RepID=A0A1C5JFP8_9ACTN|nr:FtsX-like permease family protein [Micromonospora inositola]SCG69385.1 FtsX-like permease family protein [Micromonospora inositola]